MAAVPSFFWRGMEALQHLQGADVFPLPSHVPGADVRHRNPPSLQNLHQGTCHRKCPQILRKVEITFVTRSRGEWGGGRLERERG